MLTNVMCYRVRAAIRAGDEEYAVTAESWPRFCYTNFSYDHENVEKGLWQSTLMVKVKLSLHFTIFI